MDKKDKVDILNREMLGRKQKEDKSRKGFNFVGNEYKWTDIDEQKKKVSEIENKTRKLT